MSEVGISWLCSRFCQHESIPYSRKKKEKIILASQQLLKKSIISIRLVAQVIGPLASSLPAVQCGPLYYRSLEIDKNTALRKSMATLKLL